MKTTVDLPDDLLIEAKKHAVETRTTLRELLSRGLRLELARTAERRPVRRRIRWVVAKGGLPPGLELADRARMHDCLRGQR
jgi:hypothetical protein